VKGFKSITKWLTVGALALAICGPAGAASAAAGSTNVQYKMYYVIQGGNIDWNTILQQYFQRYDYRVPATPAKRVPATPAKRVPATPAKPATQPVVTSPAAVPKPADPGTSTRVTNFASQVVSLVNQERAKASLGALAVNKRLSNMAMVKAQDMKNNNYFDHNSPTYGSPFDMMKQFGITYHYAGENIAMGQRTPREVMTAWMDSPGHKANILNKNFTSIGVAYYNGEWVQEFTG
jgi:uncharacterized YkwD family protein